VSTASVTNTLDLALAMMPSMLTRRHVGEDHVDAGIVGAQFAQDGRRPVDHRGERHAYPHPPDQAVAKPPHCRNGAIGLRPNPLSITDQRPATVARMLFPICRLTAGCVRLRRRDAAEKLPNSTTQLIGVEATHARKPLSMR